MNRIKQLSPIFLIIICGCFSSCEKNSDTEESQLEDNEIQYDIFVAGKNEDGYATYWKNGIAYVNQNLSSDYTGIAVSEGDVYTLGGSSYWKNNNLVAKIDGYSTSSTCSSSSISVSNGAVYVSGFYTTSSYLRKAAYWKDNVRTDISSGGTGDSEACSIMASGSNVYVAGYQNYPYNSGGTTGNYGTARYWVNNKGNNLGGSWQRNAVAFSIFTSANGDVYVAGYHDEGYAGAVAKYWKNGSGVSLTDGSKGATADAIIVTSNGDIHVAGRHYDGSTVRIAYWKNGVETLFGTAYNRASTIGIKSMAVTDKDIYLVVRDTNLSTKFWKNGIETAFTSESYAMPNAVVAIPRIINQ